MNKPNSNTSAARLLVPALALCLATAACDRRDAEVPGDSADATSPAAGATTAPEVDADPALADQAGADPCAGLSGPALDECRMREGSAEVGGQVAPLDDAAMGDPLDDAVIPPPVTEEPMDNEPMDNEDAEEVPRPA